MLRTYLLAAAASLFASFIPLHAEATLIYRFEPSQLNGLQAIDGEIGLADEALTRTGDLLFSDLEYARFSYTPIENEFGEATSGTFGLGPQFGTDIVPELTEFDVRTGYASWTGVRVSGDTLLFSADGASLSVADECFDLIGQIFCLGEKGRAFITPVDPSPEAGLVELFIRDDFSGCNEFAAFLCLAQGRFVLAESATEVSEPPALAAAGIMIIGIGLLRRRNRAS